MQYGITLGHGYKMVEGTTRGSTPHVFPISWILHEDRCRGFSLDSFTNCNPDGSHTEMMDWAQRLLEAPNASV